jgi:hypothetical protein
LLVIYITKLKDSLIKGLRSSLGPQNYRGEPDPFYSNRININMRSEKLIIDHPYLKPNTE